MDAREGNRFHRRHAEINRIDDGGEHCRDDHTAARRADNQPGFIILIDDGWHHAGGARLAGRHAIGASRAHIKQLHGIVPIEAKPRCDHARARAKRMRDGNAIARRIPNGKMRGAGRWFSDPPTGQPPIPDALGPFSGAGF